MTKSNTLRDQFTRLFIQNEDMNHIKQQLSGVNLATLYRWKKDLVRNGHLRPKTSPGRPEKLGPREIRLLIRNTKSNPHYSIKKLAESVGLDVHHQTVNKILKRNKLKSYVALKKPLLTPTHMDGRMEFARKYRHYDVNAWKRWSFSDESSVELHCVEGVQRFVIKQSERYEPKFIAGTRQAGGGKLMIWSFISYEGLGPLIFITGGIDGKLYKQILRQYALPHLLQVLRSTGRSQIFMDDGASCHKCDIVVDFCDEKGIQRPKWPANSPDLNPIEWVWGNIKHKLARQNPKPQNIEELKDRIAEIWDSIDVDYIQSLYNTMPRRIEAVLANKGGNTKF